MRSLNKVQLIGNLGCTPQTHVFPDGRMVANFTLATSHNWVNKSNQENQENQENANIQKEKKEKVDQKRKRTGRIEETEQKGQRESEEKQKQPVDWHNITCYGKLAEIVASYLQTGHKVYVDGYLRHRTFEDKDGCKRYITEVIGKEIIMLTAKFDKTAQEPF